MKTARTGRTSCRWLNVHSAVLTFAASRCQTICCTDVMQMSDIRKMVEDMMDDTPQRLQGFVVGDCLYLEERGNHNAWIEGKAVHCGDWQ